MEEPRQAPKWQALLLVAVVALGISALPAALAFSIGRIVGPVDEALDERMCSSQGLAESDSVYAEANDIVDATPDCAVREP